MQAPRFSTNNRARICAAARGWLGTPYHHQQSRRGVGCDCLGLVRGVWRDLGGSEPIIPPYGPSWAEAGAETLLEGLAASMDPASEILPGTVLAFRHRQNLPARHVAIACSETTMIHAYDRRNVSIVEITPFWMRRLAGLFDYPMDTL